MRLLLRNSSITQKRAIQTSHDVAKAVEQPGVRTEETTVAWAVAVDSAAVCVVKCIRPFAQSVVKTPKCPSYLAATDRSTAATATAPDGSRAPEAEDGQAALTTRP